MKRALVTFALAALMLAACRSDGRDMQPPVFPAPTPTTTSAPLATG
ncbi:MAG TPA: hypothetical protein VNQ73_13015 [Ilumatobacter sp.]|nr:hypothetical protein [Ilumatobacter sp.]